MEEIKSQTDFCSIKSGVFLREAPLPLHVEHKVTTTHKLYHKEESGRSLEAGVQTHQEGVIGGSFKDMFLSLNPVNVLKQKHNIFGQPKMEIFCMLIKCSP